MSSLVITPNTPAELAILQAVARKLGLVSFELSERDKRLFARRKMADLASQVPKVYISEEEILRIVEEVRAEYYAQKPNSDSH
jgi:hypothetical protein